MHHCVTRLLVLALIGLSASAQAGPRRKSTRVSYGTSCIDGNNNGACGDAADVPLSAAIDANGLYLDGEHGSHSGLVLQGNVSLPEFVFVNVARDINVSGRLEVNAGDLGATFQSLRGNVQIAPATQIVARNSLSFFTATPSSTMTLGRGTTSTLSGVNVELGFGASGTLHVETGQTFRVSGSGSANVRLKGDSGVQIDPGQTFSGTNRGGLYITAGGDLTLTNLTCATGYVILRAYGSAAHPGSRNIVIRNSTLHETYRHGNLKILAETPSLGTVLLDHSTIITENLGGNVINPPATCVASVAPSWACR